MDTRLLDDPRHRVLQHLPEEKLLEWCREAGLPGGRGDTLDALIGVIIESPKFDTLREILERLNVLELQLLGQDLGLSVEATETKQWVSFLVRELERDAIPSGPPLPPEDVIREGHEKARVREEEFVNRKTHRNRSNWLKAGMWSAGIAGLAWFGVFPKFIDVCLVGLGSLTVSRVIYGTQPGRPAAMGIAVAELILRLVIFRPYAPVVVSLVTLSVGQILAAAAMAIDAESNRSAELQIGLRDAVRRGGGAPDPPSLAPEEEEEQAPRPPRIIPDDPFHKEP